jgi:hypothetical protein
MEIAPKMLLCTVLAKDVKHIRITGGGERGGHLMKLKNLVIKVRLA